MLIYLLTINIVLFFPFRSTFKLSIPFLSESLRSVISSEPSTTVAGQQFSENPFFFFFFFFLLITFALKPKLHLRTDSTKLKTFVICNSKFPHLLEIIKQNTDILSHRVKTQLSTESRIKTHVQMLYISASFTNNKQQVVIIFAREINLVCSHLGGGFAI